MGERGPGDSDVGSKIAVKLRAQENREDYND
jgi:hypothetical protein